jgi:spermidine synthase
VEIDPAVYDAARRYFGMPDPGLDKVFLEDARGWVASRAIGARKDVDKGLFDFVVHDCFSGGGVPAHIFTVEFWEDLKIIVKPSGVVAIVSGSSNSLGYTFAVLHLQNFAGKLRSDSSRAILITLESVFTTCRAFHNSLQPLSEEQLEGGFMDIVTEFTSGIVLCSEYPIGLLL